jgi:hypothetical protein
MKIKTKILITVLLFFGLTTLSPAQELVKSPQIVDEKVDLVKPVTAAQNDRVIAEVVGNTERIVKGAAFSAEAITESVQTLGDGNRIVRKTVTKMYRDGEGRFRREEMPQPNGNIGSIVKVPPTIIIIDPVAKFRYILYPASKTIRTEPVKTNENSPKPIKENVRKTSEERADQMKERTEKRFELNAKRVEIAKEKTAINTKKIEIAETAKVRSETIRKVAEERKKIVDEVRKDAQETIKESRKSSGKTVEISENGKTVIKEEKNNSSRQENTKTESLGVKNIEGVEAEGTRSTKIIAAGEIGNERPINIVYEKWYSKDLQMIVMSKHIDPRFGENIYRLTNIKLSEPDQSLFTLPDDYKIINDRMPSPKFELKGPRIDLNSPRIPKPRTNSTGPNPPKTPAVEKKPVP